MAIDATIAANSYPVEVVEVLDGDTFKARVEIWPDVFVFTSVRVLGVNAPEWFHPDCPNEKVLALKAKADLEDLLKKPAKISKVKIDKFGGRIDALINAGVDVSTELLKKGIVVKYGDPKPWCK